MLVVKINSLSMSSEKVVANNVWLGEWVCNWESTFLSWWAPPWGKDPGSIGKRRECLRLVECQPVVHLVTKVLKAHLSKVCVIFSEKLQTQTRFKNKLLCELVDTSLNENCLQSEQINFLVLAIDVSVKLNHINSMSKMYVTIFCFIYFYTYIVTGMFVEGVRATWINNYRWEHMDSTAYLHNPLI